MTIEAETSRISVKARSGTGLLAVFCDLAPEWRSDFRPWLAEDMFPPRASIDFIPAASFDLIPGAMSAPPGALTAPQAPQAYVTCYVAPTAGDLYGAPYQGLRLKRAPRDAAYHQRMQNLARYAAAWVGPGIETDDRRFAPIMAIDRFDVAPSDTQDFNIWFATEYLPACAAVPGLVRLRRYLAMEGAPAHLVTYEFTDEAALQGAAWQAARDAEGWKLSRFAAGAPAAYRKVAEPVLA